MEMVDKQSSWFVELFWQTVLVTCNDCLTRTA